ncbi:MAG: 50S ribosomal protein L19 [Patescibacteria group bacterium]|jgi:large subunit ribosomal protein L19
MADEKNDLKVTNDAQPEATPEVSAVKGQEIKDPSKIKPGAVVRVHLKVKELNTKGEERERIQVFEGTVIAKKGKDAQSATITVRKIASGVGVERIFPLRSPVIAKFEEVKSLRVRKAKLYYTRTSKRALKEVK